MGISGFFWIHCYEHFRLHQIVNQKWVKSIPIRDRASILDRAWILSSHQIKYKTRSRYPSAVFLQNLFTLSHAPHAPPPTRTYRHPTTPSRLVHPTTSSSSPPPSCSPSPPPHRAVRRSAGFVEFSGFPRVHRFALVLDVASCPTSCHTGRKTTSALLVCSESSPTSGRSKSRVDSTRAYSRACDAQ